MSRKDLWIAPALEGLLILVAAAAGWAVQQPLVFASLGPTAYELIETPNRPTARPYNVIVGNLIAVLAAYAGIYSTRAWTVPSVSAHTFPLPRIWAAVVAAVLTVFLTLLAHARQPAALSTTLLISLGIMQTWHDGVVIMAGVLLMTAVGEPVRRLRARLQPIDNEQPVPW